MRESISRAELHRRFSEALAADATGGTFVFEIDVKEPGPDGCNWYPLASIQHWTGDLMANLALFRTVRAEMERAYEVEESAAVNATS
jgi:hypothetical protein